MTEKPRKKSDNFKLPEIQAVSSAQKALQHLDQSIFADRHLQRSLEANRSFQRSLNKIMKSDVIWQMKESLRQMEDLRNQFLVGSTEIARSYAQVSIPREFIEEARHTSEFARRLIGPAEMAALEAQTLMDEIRIKTPDWEAMFERLKIHIDSGPELWVGLAGIHLERAVDLSERWPKDAYDAIDGDFVIRSTFDLTDRLVEVYDDHEADDTNTGPMQVQVDRHVSSLTSLVSPKVLPTADEPLPFSSIAHDGFTRDELACIDGIMKALTSPGPDRLRHLCASLRTLEESFLRQRAPDKSAVTYLLGLDDKLHPQLLTKKGDRWIPTWNGRVFYVLRHQPLVVARFTIESRKGGAKLYSTFSGHVHGPALRDEQAVAVHLAAQLEELISYLLYFGDEA